MPYRIIVANNPVNWIDPDGLDPIDTRTGKPNPVLRCHVNTHTDREENAIGGALIFGGIGVYGGVRLIPPAIVAGTALINQYGDKIPSLVRSLEDMSQGKKKLGELMKAYKKEVDELNKNSCPPNSRKLMNAIVMGARSQSRVHRSFKD